MCQYSVGVPLRIKIFSLIVFLQKVNDNIGDLETFWWDIICRKRKHISA